MVDLDQWIPNFDLFVMTILPSLIAITIVVILLEFWKRDGKKKRDIDWMDVLIWMTMIYFTIPVWRIIQYLEGHKAFSVLIEELFIEDFHNYMALLLMVGIVGAVYIFSKKISTWRGGQDA